MKKKIFFWTLTIIIALCAGFMSCQTDKDCTYIVKINNNTSFDILVYFHDDIVIFSEKSIIVCPPNQVTKIIEDYFGTGLSTTAMYTFTAPSVFRDNFATIIIDEGNKILTKDISDFINWNLTDETYKSGKYYSKFVFTFVINEEDIKDAE
jgi:hypothetical protein